MPPILWIDVIRFARTEWARIRRLKLLNDERGVIAIVYALSLLPLVMVIALAVDFGFYILAQSQLNLAADAAAIHAVRVAQQTYIDYSSTVDQAEAAGKTAGQQWFFAQLGTLGIATVTPTVNVTYSAAPGGFAASVTYAGTVATTVGSFLIKSWPVSNSVNAQTTNNYLEVILMLDNSSSMQIGASYNDIQQMMELTACASINAYYTSYNGSETSVTAGYNRYLCSSGGNTYDGSLACPLALTSPKWTYSILQPASNTKGPSCQGWLPKQADGTYPAAGSPCAFACHDDNSKPAGSGNDFYAIARSTIGTSNPVTLRFDLLKAATKQLLSTMAAAQDISGNLSIGIYAFNSTLTQVYPAAGEAGTNFTAAAASVGGPPTVANGPDAGIQPDTLIGDAVHSNTEFSSSMDTLATQLSNSGNGNSASMPKKVMFLITDGYRDSVTGGQGAFDTTKCSNFKTMGYTIYVIYTTYYPLMNFFWLDYNGHPQGVHVWDGSTSAALKSCASDTSFYTEATDLTGINTALTNFLLSAENGSAQVSK